MCCPDCKKLGLSAGAAVLLRFVLEFLTHEVALKAVYAKPAYQALWHEALMKSRLPFMALGHVLFGLAFAWIYTRGYEESKPVLGQGLRYGALVGLLEASHAVISYFVYPVSGKLALAWLASGYAQCLVIGVAVALLYRPAPEGAHSH